ncbi:MAG TPA: hypothetical protein VKA51_07255 [Rubrobacteraceae bacterium]|nr:hypothetical protein [Rubrobacteraceae bacterium]
MPFAEQDLAYALAVVPIGVLVFGLLALAASLSTPQVLLAGAAAGLLGAAAVYLAGRPEAPAGGAAPGSLALPFLAGAGRICLAAALALARHVNSVGVAFLVAAVAPPTPPTRSRSSPAPRKPSSKKAPPRSTSCS